MHQRANPTPSLACASRPQPWASVHCQPESLSVSSKYTSRPVNLPRLWPRKILQSHDQEASSFMRNMWTPDWNILPCLWFSRPTWLRRKQFHLTMPKIHSQTCCLCTSGMCYQWSLGSCQQEMLILRPLLRRNTATRLCAQRSTRYSMPAEVVSSIVLVNDVPADPLSSCTIASWKLQHEPGLIKRQH